MIGIGVGSGGWASGRHGNCFFFLLRQWRFVLEGSEEFGSLFIL